MKTSGSRFASSGPFIALLLIVFSASGLMAGVLARHVSAPPAGGQPTSTVLTSAAQTATAAANTTPTASGTFALTVQLAPSPARAGQTVQLTVTACAPDIPSAPACGPNTTPLPGVICTLLQTPPVPSVSGAWPSPAPTDASGQAHLSFVLADQTAPGVYPINVRGDDAAPYHWTWKGNLSVAA